MNKILLILFLSIAAGPFLGAAPASAQRMGPGPHWRERAPYGDYCPGPRRGWYGARSSVHTPEEAARILQEYFPRDETVVGPVRERKWFFEAEIKDKNGSLIDRVAVDKRTGRIRSMY